MALSTPSDTGEASTPSRLLRLHARAGLREIALLAALYVGYSAVRMAASDDFMSAVLHAEYLLDIERSVGLAWEHTLTLAFEAHRWIAVAASFYYAVAHYLVTVVVLGWLWFRRHAFYPVARTALAGASLVALAGFLLMPTAPPRLFGGYLDLLALTADVGWWSEHASAPAGLAHLTNELAAMPSMHAGWALWCALVLATCSRRRWVRVLGWTHAVLTALVVIGTGNHWVLDVLVGDAVVLGVWVIVRQGATARQTRLTR